MRSSSLIQFLALLALLALLACACSSPQPATDAGTDAAVIELPDTGPPPVDAGPPDGGDGLCADLSALLFGNPPLPPECLPRCSAETRDAVAACGNDTACAEAAFDADATPPASFLTRYGVYTVACRAARTSYACVLWQRRSCYEEHCRTEYYAYADCLDRGGSCETEFEPVQACIDATPDAMTCLDERVRACFP